MATTVQFIQISTHTIQARQGGGIRYAPAIPARPGVYIIDNNGPYIGASGDLKTRFRVRLASLWEFGASWAGISIDLLRIEIGGVSTATNNLGQCSITVAHGHNWVPTIVDVEHLLMRIYIQVLGINIRNTEKWQNLFNNPFPDALDWSIEDSNNNVLYQGQIAQGGSL